MVAEGPSRVLNSVPTAHVAAVLAEINTITEEYVTYAGG
jgi:hypothetical protein